MIKVKVTQPGRSEKSTFRAEGLIESAPKIKNPLVVKDEDGTVVFETDPLELVIHHHKTNSYTVKVGRHKITVEVVG